MGDDDQSAKAGINAFLDNLSEEENALDRAIRARMRNHSAEIAEAPRAKFAASRRATRPVDPANRPGFWTMKAAHLASWALNRWYGYPELSTKQKIALAKKLDRISRRRAGDHASRALKSSQIGEWSDRVSRTCEKLLALAKEAEAHPAWRAVLPERYIHLLDLAKTLDKWLEKDRRLMALAEKPTGRARKMPLRVTPPDKRQAELDRRDFRTLLIGEILPKLYARTYPNRPFESAKVRSSAREHTPPVFWGPGPLFIDIALRCLGEKTVTSGDEIRKYRQRLARK